MPRPPNPRTPPDPSAAFGPAFRTAEARANGYSDWSTRQVRMAKPTRGVRTLAELDGVTAQAAAFGLVLPDDIVYSHLTAARILRLPLPRWLQDEVGLHSMRPRGKAPIERAGMVSHRGLERRETTVVDGVRVTSIPDTWCDIIAAYHQRLSIADVVMMGDAAAELLHPSKEREIHPEARPGSNEWWSDPANVGCKSLLERLEERRRFRGRRLAQRAIGDVRPRVWSPAETFSRLVAAEAPVPEPELNASICSESGKLIGYGDLVWGRRRPARTRLVGEYQGRVFEGKDIHTDAESSRSQDNARCERMREEGWTVMELYSGDVYTRAGKVDLMRRLRRYLA